MQELSNSIKRPNLRFMNIEEEEVHAKRIYNLFNKTITEISQISRKFCLSTYRMKIEPPHGIVSLKQQGQRAEKEY
jgi:hypothetical protein